jgi:hypothetical protein
MPPAKRTAEYYRHSNDADREGSRDGMREVKAKMFAAASSHQRDATYERAISTLGTSLCEARYHKFVVSWCYKPNFPAEFSRNKLPSRIYRRTICTDRCPVWFMMLRSDAPAIAARVA